MIANPVVPVAFGALIAWGLYRRFRRLFGRQPVQPKRMKIRIGLLLLVGAFLLLRAVAHPQMALAVAGGFGAGLALALLGLRLTRFEATAQGRFYTPHAAIGAAVSALLLGRLAYRFLVLYPQMQADHQAAANPFAGLQGSPLTSAMIALVIGYYLAYLIGVLVKSAEVANAPPREPD